MSLNGCEGQGASPWFVASASFYGVNPPTTADFKRISLNAKVGREAQQHTGSPELQHELVQTPTAKISWTATANSNPTREINPISKTGLCVLFFGEKFSHSEAIFVTCDGTFPSGKKKKRSLQCRRHHPLSNIWDFLILRNATNLLFLSKGIFTCSNLVQI